MSDDIKERSMTRDNSQDRAESHGTRLIPVTEWNRHHPWPPLGGLRHLVFYAKQNGFDAVVRRIGRRVLIDEKAFFDWVDAQNDAPASDPNGGR
jgi:hypothetical protein